MATRRMIAKRGMRYGSKVLTAGDEFSASRQDARVLEALGRAAGAPGTVPQPTSEPAPKPVPIPPAPESPASAPEIADESDPVGFQDDIGEDYFVDSRSAAPPPRPRNATKAQLAKEYEAATGGKPDGRWNKNRLEQELEAVRGSYRRRDMRAEC